MIFMLLPHFRIADAEENLGESEVREAHLAKSLFFIRIGDKVCTYYNLLIFSCLLLASIFDKHSPLCARRKPWNISS